MIPGQIVARFRPRGSRRRIAFQNGNGFHRFAVFKGDLHRFHAVHDLENKRSVPRDRTRELALFLVQYVFRKGSVGRKLCGGFVGDICRCVRSTHLFRQSFRNRIGDVRHRAVQRFQIHFYAVRRVRSCRPHRRKGGILSDRRSQVFVPRQIVTRFRPRGSRRRLAAFHGDLFFRASVHKRYGVRRRLLATVVNDRRAACRVLTCFGGAVVAQDVTCT